MSMYRAKNRNKRWRLKWPWKRLFPLRVDQRFCPECQMPFHEGPLPKEAVRCNVDSITAFVFPAGGWRKNEYVIRVGRWKAGGKQFFCSEFIPAEEIGHLIAAVNLAREEISDRQAQARPERKQVANRL